MAPATLISRSGGSTLVNGYVQYNLIHVFQVLAPRNSSIITILNWSGVPRAGAKRLLGGQVVWVGRPSVSQPNPDASKFLVTVPYSNETSNFERDVSGNPVSNPVQAVKQVRVSWETKREPVTNAKLRSITKGYPEGEGGIGVAKPSWLPTYGPITNSAGEPILAERIKRIQHISVSRVVRDWSNTWNDYQGAINQDAVTIRASDSDGVRATYTFKPLTLRLLIETPEEWKDGKLYFRPQFNMEHNEKTWIHSELDRGQKRRVFVDQYKPEGGQYTQADLDKLEIGGDYGFASIMTDNNTVAIGEPLLFNGSGAEQPLDNTTGGTYTEGQAFFLNYDVNLNIKPFSVLNL